MIKFQLSCDSEHEFEAWFASGDAFERLAKDHLIVCPHCGSHMIAKRPMAPAIVSSKSRRTVAQPQASAREEQQPPQLAGDAEAARSRLAELRALKAELLANSEDVGARFAEEARKIHFGESDRRSIPGEASLDDAKELHDDGIAFGILPPLPDEQN